MELDTLVARCKEGDEVAWEALVRRLQGRIFALCYHHLRDREEAREVAQETFIRIYRGLPDFEPGGSFLAWSARIARNGCIDRIRKLGRTPSSGAEPIEVPERGVELPSRRESFAARQARHDLLQRALEGMSRINREMILLKDIQGLSQQEIADLLAIPLGTVKARSSRARRELADRVLELDPSYGG